LIVHWSYGNRKGGKEKGAIFKQPNKKRGGIALSVLDGPQCFKAGAEAWEKEKVLPPQTKP